MASRRVINPINWTGIAERLVEQDKPMFTVLRTKSDGYLRRMQKNAESAPPIDWAYYKKTVNIPGMVDQFQKEYEALKIPYPVDKYTCKVEEQEKEAQAHVQSYINKSNEIIKEAEAEIAQVQRLIPFNEMTLEDFAEAYPDVAWNADKPTMWPHTPEVQPGPVPIPMPKAEH